jgi:hypothetical protein
MKVYLGPHPKYWGKINFVWWIPFISEHKKFELEDKVPSWLPRLFNTLFVWRREQKVKVKIHHYDTWGMDHTLAPIILPMLKQLRDTKHGSPLVDDKDVPKHLRSTSAPPKKNEWDTDSLHHDRWDWVLDEMIWAFEQKVDPEEGMKQYYVPYESYEEAKNDKLVTYEIQEDGTKVKKDLFPTLNTEWRLSRGKFDQKLYKKFQTRKNNGFMLFGKYFEALWD